MKLKKNINLGKIKLFKIVVFLYIILFFSIFETEIKAKDYDDEQFVKIKILDKVSSKNNQLIIQIGKEEKYQNLLIKALKCKNSKFDDNPETIVYLQVIDENNKNNDEVYVFNGWMFSSSPSLRPFEHPVYDIWLIKCY